MAGIATNPLPLARAGTASTAFRPYFNGQSWVTTPPTPTPEQQSQLQANQNRFTSGVRTAIDDYLNSLQQGQEAQGRATTAQSDLTRDQLRATQYNTDATAAQFQAEGYGIEQQQYTNAANSAEQDAAIADASGKIQAYQDFRKYQESAGKQAAAVAGAGFKASGSSMWLAQSALMQGNLTHQLDVVNGQERQVGYLETASAATSQAAAAGTAATAAENLAAADQAAATTASGALATDQQAIDQANAGVTNAATVGNSISQSLQSYLHNVDPSSVTPEAQLSMAVLSGSPDANLTSTVNQLNSGTGNWYQNAANGQPGPNGLPANGGTGSWMPNQGWGLQTNG